MASYFGIADMKMAQDFDDDVLGYADEGNLREIIITSTIRTFFAVVFTVLLVFRVGFLDFLFTTYLNTTWPIFLSFAGAVFFLQVVITGSKLRKFSFNRRNNKITWYSFGGILPVGYARLKDFSAIVARVKPRPGKEDLVDLSLLKRSGECVALASVEVEDGAISIAASLADFAHLEFINYIQSKSLGNSAWNS